MAEVESGENKESKVFIDEKEVEPYEEDEIIEDADRALSNQELINALEVCITRLEKLSGKKLIAQLNKTVVLICKIIAVELDKCIYTDIPVGGGVYFI